MGILTVSTFADRTLPDPSLMWQSPHPRLHHGISSTSSRHQSGTGPFPITANIQDLPSTLYSAGPLALSHSCRSVSVIFGILKVCKGGVTGQHRDGWLLSLIAASTNFYCRLGKLLLSVIAMPIIGTSHTDDPICAWLSGSTGNLWIGVYHSGCLRDRVPLWGKGMSDQLPVDVSSNPGLGSWHRSAGSNSGSALGPSESAGMGCSWLNTSSGHNTRSISTSWLLADLVNV